ncbi:hydrogenase maturation protease [Thermovirga lienii DSM 17291]|jgi:hydrogenase 3 maturation protease|uniref:Hydrogenase maturation protease n=1 Tax=Thermovirga lienii (strain ATCC BAA-1197 / DSM 17291 / Cas60314) TaxID=580340 RepID=G7V8G8_THELD|nr:hydrogenase maturation protease [Thermovirga lienii]MDN5319030.1 hydrogenase 3 maturation protease [Thermovirga sp.]AER66330.1 hydrogenase maturation protease [Thermovirga lienii DSM 17291]KUK42857.1 MAG: Hydrogenase maturation protease [Thermovirga lienii]MDN5367884.1 hydrogenase 3 maturation protease [Thermovirga sp.]HCD72302.1 hypothetical protein [Thermovirga lienii]
MRNNTLIWGLGNELLGDDAAGVVLARKIQQDPPPFCTAYECGLTPENFLKTIDPQTTKTLLVVDAADLGAEPGSTFLLSLDEEESVNFSSHGLPLGLMLEPYRNLVEIVLIAIQPYSLALGQGLSEPVAEAVDMIEKKIRQKAWHTIPWLHQEKRSPK